MGSGCDRIFRIELVQGMRVMKTGICNQVRELFSCLWHKLDECFPGLWRVDFPKSHPELLLLMSVFKVRISDSFVAKVQEGQHSIEMIMGGALAIAFVFTPWFIYLGQKLRRYWAAE